MTEHIPASRVQIDYVLGLDPGINAAGVSLVDLRASVPILVASWTVRPTVGEHWTVKMGHIIGALEEITHHVCRTYPVGLFAYEAAHYQKNHQTTRKLAQVNGVWRTLAHRECVSVVEVQPIQAKHAIGAHNEAGVRDMKRALRLITGGADLTDMSAHEVSASAMAIAAPGLYLRQAI